MDNEDYFKTHIADPDEHDLSRRLEAMKTIQWHTIHEQSEILGKITRSVPKTSAKGVGEKPNTQTPVRTCNDLSLKKRLLDPASRSIPHLDSTQSVLAPVVFRYQDLLYCGRTPQNADAVRKLTALHAINHVFKTRDRVLANNEKSQTAVQKAQDQTAPEARDQGFTRPKVLVLLETRSACVKYVESIVAISAPDQQENRKRFQDAFQGEEDKYDDDKAEDFRELFEGNDDNDFRLGLKFTRKTLKFYSQFYSSDIIIASPLGLRRAIKADEPKKRDYDFLSSIEILIMDQADAMLMQNFDHVSSALAHLNLPPRNTTHTDFSRVRQYYLDDQARHIRQTIILSAYLTPELNALYTTQMQNIAGKTKITPIYKGAMTTTDLPIHQTFSRFTSHKPTSEPDDRFTYFTTTIMPTLANLPEPENGGLGILIFIPSYLDFVRVRNYFSSSTTAQSLSFGTLSEYTDLTEARRARSHFASGRHAVLLYTGRAHHFRRYRLKGVRSVVMYGLPENPLFYSEIAGGFLEESVREERVHVEDARVKVLFSRWDGLALERVVGSKRVRRMLGDAGGDVFDFR